MGIGGGNTRGMSSLVAQIGDHLAKLIENLRLPERKLRVLSLVVEARDHVLDLIMIDKADRRSKSVMWQSGKGMVVGSAPRLPRGVCLLHGLSTDPRCS
jgi:hypothetical protein